LRLTLRISGDRYYKRNLNGFARHPNKTGSIYTDHFSKDAKKENFLALDGYHDL